MKRVIDVLIGLLLFASGVLAALVFYALSHLFSPLGAVAPWWRWAPWVAFGCVPAIAAIGLYFRMRLAGIVGSLSVLAIAILSLQHATEPVTIELPSKPVDVPEFFVTTAPLLLIAVLVWWRFVMVRRAKTITI
jgi:hypothetical protein